MDSMRQAAGNNGVMIVRPPDLVFSPQNKKSNVILRTTSIWAKIATLGFVTRAGYLLLSSFMNPEAADSIRYNACTSLILACCTYRLVYTCEEAMEGRNASGPDASNATKVKCFITISTKALLCYALWNYRNASS